MSPSPTAKARTIQHMNNDHRTDLSHILQHYNGLSPSEASDPEMVDIALDGVTVLTAGGTVKRFVAFDPPMQSFDERRPRLVNMTMAAREALGIITEDSPGGGGHGEVTAAKYQPPRGTDWIVFCGVVLYFGCFALVKGGWVEPGSLVWQVTDGLSPGGADGFKWLVDTIFVPVLGIHLGEMWWFDRTRCVPYGVERGSTVWFLWLGNVFLEGYGTFVRFDGMVKNLKQQR